LKNVCTAQDVRPEKGKNAGRKTGTGPSVSPFAVIAELTVFHPPRESQDPASPPEVKEVLRQGMETQNRPA